ncbi:MAG: DUF4340 domain-containing protein [Fibrobacterota bacterium]|nr:DUF4340 domain-containing protein [Fibrobacterota bacterium]
MKRTLIVLLAALALLAGILMKKRSNENSMSKDAPAIDSSWKANAASVRIIKNPDTSALEKKDGKWVVSKDGFSVDTAKINKVLGHVFRLQKKERVSNSAARLSEYGLDSVEAKHLSIKDASGKVLAEVVIGKTSGADYSSTYWKWEDKPEVYRTPGNFTWEIATKNDDWKDRKLFGATAKDVKFVETSWIDSTGKPFAYKLESVTDSTWKMIAPQDSNRVKNAMASEMATRFAEMSVDEFVAPTDTNFAKVKLDTPTVWVKVGLKNGTVHELKASKTLGGFAYTQHPTQKDLIKLSPWRFDSFKKKPFELLDAPPAPKIDSIHPADAIKIEPALPSPTPVKKPTTAPAPKP